MTAFHSILGALFSNQSTSSTIFAQISPNLPEKELKNLVGAKMFDFRPITLFCL